MELKKANLHMDQIKCQAKAQITLEEDKNITDRNPDAYSILMENGRILIDEVQPGIDFASVKGKMIYEVLYLSDENQGRIYRIQGELPWEEKIRVEGADPLDSLRVKADMEDLKTSLINSRKVNIRALLNLCVEAKEIRDEEVLLEILNPGKLEIKKETYEQSVLVLDKKDIFRIKEDLELPSTLPPVKEVLWKSLDLEKWEIRPLEEKIGIQGELKLFLLYDTYGEGQMIKSYETKIPFSGNIDCPGSNGGMITDIVPFVSSWNINVKQDYDGEERIVDLEMVLEIGICLYENRTIEAVTDVYGTGNKVSVESAVGKGKKYREKYQARVKAAEVISVLESSGRIMQICHTQAQPVIEETKQQDGCLEVEGVVLTRILYMTDKEEKPYEMLKSEIPFQITLDNLSLLPDSIWKVNAMMEQCNVIILDEGKMEVKLSIGLDLLLADCQENSRIKNIKLEPFDKEQMEKIPGIMVYIPNKKEDLWEIGKRYAISINSIKEINQLTKQEVEKGEKILLVKE